MPVIDERGRLFGKLNLIDALLILVVIVLIPVTYGAFVLFRPPSATITSIEPSTVAQPPITTPPEAAPSITIRGMNLRPYLRARIGTTFAPFLIETPGVAEVKLPNMPPGTYDFALFDEAQQIVVKPRALTILGPPPTQVQVLGAFVGLSAAVARSVVIGLQFAQKGVPPVAQVLAVRGPEPATRRVRVGENAFVIVPVPGESRVPAIIRLRCFLANEECRVGDTLVAQNATIALPASDGSGQVTFAIDEVRPADAQPVFVSVRASVSSAVATVRVRFVAGPELLAVMKVGDTDVPGTGVVDEADRAVLTQVGSDQHPTTAGVQTQGFQLQQPVIVFTGTVRVPVVSTPAGWTYKDRPIKVGAGFSFETTSAAIAGWIIDIKLNPKK